MLNGIGKTQPEVICDCIQFDSPSSGLQEGKMIMTSGQLAYEPMVIILQHLRRELWQNMIDSEEKNALFCA